MAFAFLQDQKFLGFAFQALGSHFPTRRDFDNYFKAIETDERKNLFLKTASFYLFLVKGGDWTLRLPNWDPVIDYLTETYKYISIFSLIESLFAEERHLDFYEFLTLRRSKTEFPITNKLELEQHYRRYKDEFGSTRRCISFFRALSRQRQEDLVAKLKIAGAKPSIEGLAKYLYRLRSEFVHEGELILAMSEPPHVSRPNEQVEVCRLSILDAMTFFEEGLIVHFQMPVKDLGKLSNKIAET